jgi:hypothetical protein
MLGHDVGHAPPSNTKVKNEYSCTSARPVCLHGMERDRFIELKVKGWLPPCYFMFYKSTT